MIITIDGPAAAGKGTLASALAKKYKLAYFDTGMVYRAVGLQMVLDNADLSDVDCAQRYAKELTFPQMMKLSLHKDFRSDIGGRAASVVSAITKVRQELLAMQQNFALNPVFVDGTKAKGVVYDGRDTGTVICPDADLKIFITADQDIRAKRRYDEFLAKGIKTDYEKVLSDMQERDKRDTARAMAPLKPAKDAVVIDTSDLTIEQVFTKVCDLIEERELV